MKKMFKILCSVTLFFQTFAMLPISREGLRSGDSAMVLGCKNCE
ncbi:MAG TPA: hypothetical protein PLC42_08305 [Parachlamydiaceae bacterium]|nr:hypothetical protein [Parachlamydiaceae bacterium]